MTPALKHQRTTLSGRSRPTATNARKPRKHYRVKGRTAYACETCGNHIYPLAGTIFEKSSTALRIWFHAMYLMGSTRCGISAKQIQRETGVTYKTAWRIFHQIRKLMGEEIQLGGEGGGGVEWTRCTTADGARTKRAFTAGRSGEENGGDGNCRAQRRADPGAGQSRSNDVCDGVLVQEYVLPESTVFTDETRPTARSRS